MKIMFSIQFGDSIAHVLRTRGLAKKLREDGHQIKYVISSRAFSYLKGFVDANDMIDNQQAFGYSRLEPFSVLVEKFCGRVTVEHAIYSSFSPDLVIGDMGLVPSS